MKNIKYNSLYDVITENVYKYKTIKVNKRIYIHIYIYLCKKRLNWIIQIAINVKLPIKCRHKCPQTKKNRIENKTYHIYIYIQI